MARIATIQEMAPYAGIVDMGKADDQFMQLLLDGAELFFERTTGRLFSPLPELVNEVDTAAPVIKKFSARGRRLINIPDLRTATAVTLDGAALVEDSGYYFDAYVEPATQFSLVSYPASGSRGELAITGRWGWNPSPPDAKSAIITLAARIYKKKDTLWSDTIQTAEGAVFFFSRNMPEEVEAVWRSYRTPNFAIV